MDREGDRITDLYNARFDDNLQRIRENDPGATHLVGIGADDFFLHEKTDEYWEKLGRDIANNDYLERLPLDRGDFDDQKMSFFFRGLTGSNSIKKLALHQNRFSSAGIRSMVPFLQNANSLKQLILYSNNIQSEGFNLVFRALRDSPIEQLDCNFCGIQSIEIDSENAPKQLNLLSLNGNRINAEGCRELTKLLRGRDPALTRLYLGDNRIGDEGVDILVNTLKTNTSLMTLNVTDNAGLSDQGKVMLLKLVNNISSIEATLQSNHTLESLSVDVSFNRVDEIQRHIDMATKINKVARNNVSSESVEDAGRSKMIQTQLNSAKRTDLSRLQGVSHSVYSEIDPLHLPEVLSLIGRYHSYGDFHLALLASIMAMLSTVNMKGHTKQDIQQQQDRTYHATTIAGHQAEVTVAEHGIEMEELDGKLSSSGGSSDGKNDNECSNKRRRK